MQDPRASGEPQAHGCVVRMQAAMSAVSGGWTAGEGELAEIRGTRAPVPVAQPQVSQAHFPAEPPSSTLP